LAEKEPGDNDNMKQTNGSTSRRGGIVSGRKIAPTDLGRIVDRAVDRVRSWPAEYQRSASTATSPRPRVRNR